MPSKLCPHCGASFTTSQPSALYCSRTCKTGAANLEASRGKQLYRLAYGWRSGSGVKFSELSYLVDQWKREDKECGRPPPVFDRLDHRSTAQAYLEGKDKRQRVSATGPKGSLELANMSTQTAPN